MPMKSPLRPLAGLLAVAAAVLCLARQAPTAPPALPDTPAGKRLRAMTEAVNTKDPATIRKFVQDNVAESARKSLGNEERVKRLIGIAGEIAPLKLLEVPLVRPTTVGALIQAADGNRLAIRLDVEPNPPYGITGIRLGPPSLLRDRPVPREFTRWKGLADLAVQVREHNKVPGLAIAVARPGQRTEVAVAGVRDLESRQPVQRGDLWWVGSIGKSMTATLVARLIERGLLDWDTTLAQALPGVPMRPEYRNVTLEQLMQHRGGVPADLMFTGVTVQRIVGKQTDGTKIRAAYVADILQREPVAKPGERMVYSNAGYALLSHIAERKGKKPFEALMRDLLFRPLGMTSAVVSRDGTPGLPGKEGQPRGHRDTPEGLKVWKWHVGPLDAMAAGAGGGIACTAQDLTKYGMLHLEGLRGKSRLLKPATIRRLHTPKYSDRERYASGWSIEGGLTPQPYHGHNGSNGSMLAELAIWPEQGLVVVGFTNVGGEDPLSPPLQAALAVARSLEP